MLKNLRYVLIGLLFTARALAQDERDMDVDNLTFKIASNRIFGKITDAITNKPLEAVSVQLYGKGVYEIGRASCRERV